MIKLCSLSSGSCGNAIYIEAGNTKLLVDAGLSLTALNAGLKAVNAELSEITAVLITHEHSDHISGIRTLSRRLNLPIYANSPTIDAAPSLFANANLRVFPVGKYFHIGELDIQAFPTSHDCRAPVGFCFYYKRQKIGVATDLGTVTTVVLEALVGFDALLLEANHDEKMLASGRYPAFLKQRIQGEFGHLSNRAAASVLTRLASSRPQKVLLGHLSAENNSPSMAHDTVSNILEEAGIDSVALSLAPRKQLSELVTMG